MFNYSLPGKTWERCMELKYKWHIFIHAHRKICVHVYTYTKKENAEYVASAEQVST